MTPLLGVEEVISLGFRAWGFGFGAGVSAIRVRGVE